MSERLQELQERYFCDADEERDPLSVSELIEMSDLQREEIERLTRENQGSLGQINYWQRLYGECQSELVELRDRQAAKAGGDDEQIRSTC